MTWVLVILLIAVAVLFIYEVFALVRKVLDLRKQRKKSLHNKDKQQDK